MKGQRHAATQPKQATQKESSKKMFSSSSSSRFMSLVGFAVLALSSVACMQPSESEEESQKEKGGFFSSSNGSKTNANANEDGAAEAGGGTCEGACAHYLECKGMSTSQNQATCTTNCKGLGLKAADLASFQQSDCATAIAAVEGTSSSSSSSGGSNGGGSKGSECNGCVKDGDSCIWLSQSDWGPGPYSGAAATCESHCCQ